MTTGYLGLESIELHTVSKTVVRKSVPAEADLCEEVEFGAIMHCIT